MNQREGQGRLRIWVIDRIEGESVLLQPDEGAGSAEVPRSRFGVEIREGMVLRVPASDTGTLDWGSAEPDPEEERRRRREAEDILRGLKRRDPGGDVNL